MLRGVHFLSANICLSVNIQPPVAQHWAEHIHHSNLARLSRRLLHTATTSRVLLQSCVISEIPRISRRRLLVEESSILCTYFTLNLDEWFHLKNVNWERISFTLKRPSNQLVVSMGMIHMIHTMIVAGVCITIHDCGLGWQRKIIQAFYGSETLVDLLGQSVPNRNLERLWRAFMIGLFRARDSTFFILRVCPLHQWPCKLASRPSKLSSQHHDCSD